MIFKAAVEIRERLVSRIAAQSVALGGAVRVGLEDSLWIGAGRLAESNPQQVKAARQIIEGLGLELATPDEARTILGLKAATTSISSKTGRAPKRTTDP